MPSYEEYGFPGRPRRFRESPAPMALMLFLMLLLALSGLAIAYFVFGGDRRPNQDGDKAGLLWYYSDRGAANSEGDNSARRQVNGC